MRRFNNSKGSLLIEALLSVVILSISLTLIIRSMTSSLRATIYSLDYAKAGWLADNTMFTFLHTPAEVEGGSKSGEFSPPFEKYGYEMEIKEFSRDGESLPLEVVHLDIFWGRETQQRQVSLKAVIFLP